MKNYFWIPLLFLFLGFPMPLCAESSSPLRVFQQANAAYREDQYAHAASLYESLIARGWEKTNVYYNLGNTYFKQERLGLAILHYEKARRLKPRDRDISANLKYVRGLLEYRVEDKRNWYVKMGEAFLQSFTQKEIGMTGLALTAFLWMSWNLQLYFRPGTPWGWKRKVFLVLTLGSLSLWGLKGICDAAVQEAIVLESRASVRYGPSHKDQVAFRLEEGMKVRLSKRAGEWSRVILTNGETGWMFQEQIGVI